MGAAMIIPVGTGMSAIRRIIRNAGVVLAGQVGIVTLARQDAFKRVCGVKPPD
jgi:hypothetical protein